jgi:hypothetical protein
MAKLHIVTINLTPKQRDLLAPLLETVVANNAPGQHGAILIQPDNTLTTAQAIAIPYGIAVSIHKQVQALTATEQQ